MRHEDDLKNRSHASFGIFGGIMATERTLTKEQNHMRKDAFMTTDEINRINEYIDDLNLNKGDMGELYSEWGSIEKYYGNDQEELSRMPNSKINVLNANIEGQASMISEQEIAVITKGEGAGDDDFAEDGRIGLEWTLRKNSFKSPLRAFIRRLLKFGAGILYTEFDKDALGGFGLVRIYAVSPNSIFVDRKIKDPLLYQDGEYIAYVIQASKNQMIEIYGEDKANAVNYGTFTIEDTVFDSDTIFDSDKVTDVIKYFSRNEGKLRLEEFSGCGMLLFDSHKGLNRKENQKEKEVSARPYYSKVNNKYPFFISVLYQREECFWGFGDGKLLLNLQKLINELYDKIRICARPNLIMFDINADVDLDGYSENCLEPRPFDGTGSADPVKVYPWGTVNENWWRLLVEIYRATQRVTRFSELMTGQDKSGDTATEAAIQHQQGNMATDDKKSMLQPLLSEMLSYILGLMIEFYTEGRSFRVNSESNEYKWIDFRKMANSPVKIPATDEFAKEYLAKNQEVPKWQMLTDDEGNPLTKSIELDIEVNIGAGLPKNKTFITKFLTDMSKAVLIDQQGQQKPVIYWDEMRDFLKKYIGLPIKDIKDLQNAMNQPPPNIAGAPPMQQVATGQGGQLQPQPTPGAAPAVKTQPNPNVMGMGQTGPQTGGLTMIRGGTSGLQG